MRHETETRKGKMMKRQCEVTVRRVDGTVETLVHPTIPVMTDTLWSQMSKAMVDAGRGECLSYTNSTVETDGDRKRAEQRRKEREFDNLHNDGGDGYNPYRTQHEAPDATPHHKGDDIAD